MFLAPLADMVKEASYEVSESIRQVITLQASGADVFLVAAPKIRRAGDPQILRPCCLEHSALPQLCVGVDRNGAQAGRTRQVKGAHIDRLCGRPRGSMLRGGSWRRCLEALLLRPVCQFATLLIRMRRPDSQRRRGRTLQRATGGRKSATRAREVDEASTLTAS
jgi:hypothetical protein